MSEDSGHASVGDAIVTAVAVFALVMFLVAVALATFVISPGMAILGAVKMGIGASWSVRQMWVLAAALSVLLMVALCIRAGNVGAGLATYLVLCGLTLGGWAVATYGLEVRLGEEVAALYFPGFSINEKPSPEPATRVSEVPARPLSEQAQAVEPTPRPVPVEEVLAPPEATPTPTPIPMATFQVALRLPLKRAYVMVRLNDREVFRTEFRWRKADLAPDLVTPPIQTVAGPVELKVWVISPDKKDADEYVVMPIALDPGANRVVALAVEPSLPLRERLKRTGS